MCSRRFYLAVRTDLLQPAGALLDQPATAQADGAANVPDSSAVEAGAVAIGPLRFSTGA